MGIVSGADLVEQQILDRSAGDFAAASTDAAARSSALSVLGYSWVDVYVDVTTIAAITELAVMARSSAEAAPNVATAADWGTDQIDNINVATGESDLQDYMPTKGITVNGKYKFTFPVKGSQMSFLIWAKTGAVAGSRGTVSAIRRV